MPFAKDVFMCKMICFSSLDICIDVHHISLLFSLQHRVGAENYKRSYTYSDDDNWISVVSKEAYRGNEIRFTVSERPRAHTSIHSFLSLRCDKEVVKLFNSDSQLCIRATITCIQTLPFISWLCWEIIPLNFEEEEEKKASKGCRLARKISSLQSGRCKNKAEKKTTRLSN